jgi:hypothetical protein
MASVGGLKSCHADDVLKLKQTSCKCPKIQEIASLLKNGLFQPAHSLSVVIIRHMRCGAVNPEFDGSLRLRPVRRRHPSDFSSLNLVMNVLVLSRQLSRPCDQAASPVQAFVNAGKQDYHCDSKFSAGIRGQPYQTPIEH